MAQFKGTFQLLPEVGKIIKLSRQARATARASFYKGCADAILDFAERLPVLTGQTRGAVYFALKDFEKYLRRFNLELNYADTLSKTLTTAKFTEDKPVSIQDKKYTGSYPLPGYEEGVVNVRGRKDWREKAQNYLHYDWDTGKGKAEISAYRAVANQYRGIYTLFFALNIDYWEDYDARGVGDFGPHHMTKLLERDIQNHVADMQNDFTSMVATAISDLMQGNDDLAERGVQKYWNKHLLGEEFQGSFEAPTDDVPFDYNFELEEDEVPF